MMLSDFISQLNQVKAAHGDMEVFVNDEDGEPIEPELFKNAGAMGAGIRTDLSYLEILPEHWEQVARRARSRS